MFQMMHSSKLYIGQGSTRNFQSEESRIPPGTSAATWTMATGSCGDPWRGVRTDTRVNSLIFSKEGVGERDVLRLSRTDDVITLLRQYGLRCSAAVGMHNAI